MGFSGEVIMAGMKLRGEREVLPRPTEAELDILRILWEHGERTVREVHESLYGSDGAGYTTALKLMQIMHAKGLVERNDSQRAHVYRAAVSQQRTQKRFMAEMVQRLFNGSASQLVLHALGDHPRASKAELQQIRDLLNRIDAEKAAAAQARKDGAP